MVYPSLSEESEQGDQKNHTPVVEPITNRSSPWSTTSAISIPVFWIHHHVLKFHPNSPYRFWDEQPLDASSYDGQPNMVLLYISSLPISLCVRPKIRKTNKEPFSPISLRSSDDKRETQVRNHNTVPCAKNPYKKFPKTMYIFYRFNSNPQLGHPSGSYHILLW